MVVRILFRRVIIKEFKCKNRYIRFHQFELFAIKAAKNIQAMVNLVMIRDHDLNNKKIPDICHHNFKNIPC